MMVRDLLGTNERARRGIRKQLAALKIIPTKIHEP